MRLEGFTIKLRTTLELSEVFFFLYLLVFLRQYAWLIESNYFAWIVTLALSTAIWILHLRYKEPNDEPTPRIFWLMVGLPLLLMFALKFALPDISVDVLNHRLIQGERGLSGPLFKPGDFFPTIFPFNPASDMLTGISRRLLGYRLGTIINYFSLLYAGIVLNKLLRPFVTNERWRCLGVLSVLFTEHILFEINNYMVDLLTLPLLLDATRLALREDGDKKQLKRDLIYTALYLGACIAFKLTNVIPVFVIALLMTYRIVRKYSWLDVSVVSRIALALLISALPIAPHALYIFRQTGSPVFPLYNKTFNSPFWASMNIAEGRWGPENFWQTLVWPVLMFFRPQRIAELPVYSGRLTVGFLAAICCLLLPRIQRQMRLVACAVLLGSILWSLSVGYIRYALYLELLSGIILIYLITYTRHSLSKYAWRPILQPFSYLLVFMIAAQFGVATYYAYYYEWSMRPAYFENPGAHQTDARFVLRDRQLVDFLAADERPLISQVGVWIVSNIKMNGIQVLLRNDIPMIAVNNLQYFDMPQSRERFTKAMEKVKGRRMFSLSLTQDLDESLDFLKKRRLQPVQLTRLIVPFFSKHTIFDMQLIELAPVPKPPAPTRTDHAQPVTDATGPLDDEAFKAYITMSAPPTHLRAGQQETIHVSVKNVSEYLWSARGQPDGKLALNAGDIWFDASGDNLVNNLDARTTIPHDLYPAEEIDLPLQIKVPATPGEYVLEIDMVQEGVSWFKERGSTPFRVKVHVD